MNREPEALGKQRDYYSKAGIFASVKDQLDGNGGGGDKDAVKDTTIAPEWVADKVYKWGELCTYEGELYMPAPAYMENPDTEAFDPTQWYKTSMYSVLKDRAIEGLIDPKSLAPEYYHDEEEPYSIGDIVCYNPDESTSDYTVTSPWKLFRCTSDVSGDTGFVEDHWTEISIMEYLEDYYQPPAPVIAKDIEPVYPTLPDMEMPLTSIVDRVLTDDSIVGIYIPDMIYRFAVNTKISFGAFNDGSEAGGFFKLVRVGALVSGETDYDGKSIGIILKYDTTKGKGPVISMRNVLLSVVKNQRNQKEIWFNGVPQTLTYTFDNAATPVSSFLKYTLEESYGYDEGDIGFSLSGKILDLSDSIAAQNFVVQNGGGLLMRMAEYAAPINELVYDSVQIGTLGSSEPYTNSDEVVDLIRKKLPSILRAKYIHTAYDVRYETSGYDAIESSTIAYENFKVTRSTSSGVTWGQDPVAYLIKKH